MVSSSPLFNARRARIRASAPPENETSQVGSHA
jgi:hypothetical protein